MRLKLLISSLGMLMAISAVSMALDEPDRIIWCPRARVINLAQCRGVPPNAGERWIAFPLHEGCLGAPEDAERIVVEKPECIGVQLMDERLRIPVVADCEMLFESLGDDLQVESLALGGAILVPSWVDRARIRCPRFADVVISANAPEEVVVLPRGRVVEITVRAHPAFEPHELLSHQGRIEVQQSGGTFSIEEECRLGVAVSLGSVPTGHYTLTMTYDGAATIVDALDVTEADVPLQLLYEAAPGHCLTVPVHCPECDVTTTVDYRLYVLPPTGLPHEFAHGVFPLRSENGNVWQGEVCDLPQGTYELRLISRGYQPVSRIVKVGHDNPVVEGFHLARGIKSWADVISEDGAPIPAALAVISWRSSGQLERAEVTADERGHVELPPLPSNTRFRLFVAHDSYLEPDWVEGLAGDRLLIILKAKGGITASLIGDACDDEPPDLVVEVEWFGAEQSQKRIESYRPDTCTVDIPVARPGTYHLTITGPGFVPYRKQMELHDSLNCELGEIELRSGKTLSVKIVHNQEPVPGAAVRISRSGPSKVTDNQGVAEFAILDADSTSVSLYVSHPGFAPKRAAYDVSGAQDLVVEILKGGEIFGRVLTENGLPAAGETIFASGWDQMRTTVDAKGHYSFSRLDPGQWRVSRLRIVGERPAQMIISTGDSQYVTVHEGDSVQVDFTPMIHVQGRVFVDGRLSSKATIGAVHLSGSAGRGPSLITVPVDEFGEYATHLPAVGNWAFRYGQRLFTTEIANCPCVLDLHFATGQSDP